MTADSRKVPMRVTKLNRNYLIFHKLVNNWQWNKLGERASSIRKSRKFFSKKKFGRIFFNWPKFYINVQLKFELIFFINYFFLLQNLREPCATRELKPITFWTSLSSNKCSKKACIIGATSSNFKKNSTFSTPIKLAMDPPDWAQMKNNPQEFTI